MAEFRSQQFAGSSGVGQHVGVVSAGGGTARLQPPQTTHIPQMPTLPKPETGAEEPLGLIEDAERPGTEGKIRAFGSDAGGSVRKEHYTRKPNVVGTGSCRIRSFHGRLSQQGLEYMDNQINNWLDANPDIEVKTVTSTVGVFEGKMREPALILNLWY